MNRQEPKDVIDPVCGMTVNPKSAPAEAEHEGKTYYFCAPVCKERFEQSPEKYVDITS